MKQSILSLFFLFLFIFSCSNDKLDNEDSVTIVGEWKFKSLDTNEASGNVELANDILMVLVAGGCDVLSFDFKTDHTVTSFYRDFTETGKDVNVAGTGLLIECPETVNVETTLWELTGNQLSFIDDDGAIKTVTIQIVGSTLIIPGEVLDENNLAGTKAIFEKQ